MKYVGLQTQIDSNNRKSALLLIAFPCIILVMVYVFIAAITYLSNGYYDAYGQVVHQMDFAVANWMFLKTVPFVIGGVTIWFLIAYFWNASMVKMATGAQSVSRKENPRLYNIVENLCMSCGMDMPQINIVHDSQLNAFASGIDKKSYTVTVTTGLMELLNDEELQGVIGHELTHIRNRDTRLLITSIVFVGIISTITSIVFNMLVNNMFYGGSRRDRDKGGVSVIVVMVIGLACCVVAYVFAAMTRFAISRKREYMADAGGAELCQNPLALASALRKISGNPGLQNIGREDVAQLFIVHPQGFTDGITGFFNSMFSTHPDIEKRIAYLEQF